MASPSPIFASLPEPSLFSFPPSSHPTFIPPPPPASAPFAAPISIPDHIYQAALDPRVPITIATLYAISAKVLNAYNRSTGKKPWAISRTPAFHAFVVLHNVFLAVYSAWTFLGMFSALRRSMVSPLGPDGLAGFADSVCRLHGPAGFGQSVFFADESRTWQALSPDAALAGNGEPLRTEGGRMWNEGLAFYGWIFYLSKFYEVLDTFIILAKGKFSSTLQTYHHAGAMMCMWAGMRYMSPPIWIFVFFNSGIHAMMYTYYTVTAFSIRVPVVLKRTLTTLQITQFVVGASLAMVHSFVSYTVPVVTLDEPNPPVVRGSTTAATETAASLLDGIKRILSGAASAAAPNESLAHLEQHQAATTTHGGQTVPCIPTNGATYAIWLNVLYLAPLTYLFVKFFITSYLRRSSAEQARARKVGSVKGDDRRRLSNVALAERAGWDAARSVEREVYGQGGGEEAVVMEDEEGEGDGEDTSHLRVHGHGKAKGRMSRNRS